MSSEPVPGFGGGFGGLGSVGFGSRGGFGFLTAVCAGAASGGGGVPAVAASTITAASTTGAAISAASGVTAGCGGGGSGAPDGAVAAFVLSFAPPRVTAIVIATAATATTRIPATTGHRLREVGGCVYEPCVNDDVERGGSVPSTRLVRSTEIAAFAVDCAYGASTNDSSAMFWKRRAGSFS